MKKNIWFLLMFFCGLLLLINNSKAQRQMGSLTRGIVAMDQGMETRNIAWQNVFYNQSRYTDYYLGVGMKQPPMPKIFLTPLSIHLKSENE